MTLWIGLDNKDELGVFRWQDNSPLMNGLIWSPGQPRFLSICAGINTGSKESTGGLAYNIIEAISCNNDNVGLCQKHIGEQFYLSYNFAILCLYKR